MLTFGEKAMAPYSSTLAWKIPWREEPGELQSMGSQGVGHDWATSLSLFTFMHWRRKWQTIPVFLHGESQGLQSLVGCCPWGHTESDMTEATRQQQQQQLTFGPYPSRFVYTWSSLSQFSNHYKVTIRSILLEKAMVTHSSTLAWKIPRTEEPGGLLLVPLHFLP